MTRVKISTILHDAADNYLALNCADQRANPRKEHFSCVAIFEAIKARCRDKDGLLDWPRVHRIESRIEQGLQNLGLNVESLTAFLDVDGDKDFYSDDYPSNYNVAQQTRYAWLKFVALLAEEQGV